MNTQLRLLLPGLAALALLGLPRPGVAQQPPRDLVPFKATYTVMNATPSFGIPIDPLILSQQGMITGASDALGSFTGVSQSTARLGVDGTPLFGAVVGAWTAPNGDALSVELTNLFRPPTTPGVLTFDGAFVISNGKGRFLGVTGSGLLTGTVDLSAGKTTLSLQGLITRPKP